MDNMDNMPNITSLMNTTILHYYPGGKNSDYKGEVTLESGRKLFALSFLFLAQSSWKLSIPVQMGASLR